MDNQRNMRIKSIAREFYRQRQSLKQRMKEHPIEATAIGDLAFLLLIFFIVTSSFILRQGIFLSLPSENAGTIKVEPEMLLNIYVQERDYLVNEKHYTRSEFINYLKAKKKEKPDIIALIYMRSDIIYDRLVDTLSAVKESNIRQLSLKNI